MQFYLLGAEQKCWVSDGTTCRNTFTSYFFFANSAYLSTSITTCFVISFPSAYLYRTLSSSPNPQTGYCSVCSVSSHPHALEKVRFLFLGINQLHPSSHVAATSISSYSYSTTHSGDLRLFTCWLPQCFMQVAATHLTLSASHLFIHSIPSRIRSIYSFNCIIHLFIHLSI